MYICIVAFVEYTDQVDALALARWLIHKLPEPHHVYMRLYHHPSPIGTMSPGLTNNIKC